MPPSIAFSTPPLASHAVAKASEPKPEFFSLPKRGGDPFFNCTRSWYYAAEKAGLIRLVRIRQRGKLRGITRVPYDDVARLFAEASNA